MAARDAKAGWWQRLFRALPAATWAMGAYYHFAEISGAMALLSSGGVITGSKAALLLVVTFAAKENWLDWGFYVLLAAYAGNPPPMLAALDGTAGGQKPRKTCSLATGRSSAIITFNKMCRVKKRVWFGFADCIGCLVLGYGLTQLRSFRKTPFFIVTECCIAFLPFLLGNVLIITPLCRCGKVFMRQAYVLGVLGMLLCSIAYYKLFGLQHLEEAICGYALSTYLSGLLWVFMHRKWYIHWNDTVDEELTAAGARGTFPWHAGMSASDRIRLGRLVRLAEMR
ncbi:hypothetical protein AC578_5572 [Pseudocercospora eumusae]|uniref:Uncharacterized protein n=1 Tax=Pseudocercospora eumusae TaxID=321146 RepID=A0A139HT86_9PEZI|nr:hypothetical protein AC578_5572 [Pseudocercospora eumusae]